MVQKFEEIQNAQGIGFEEAVKRWERTNSAESTGSKQDLNRQASPPEGKLDTTQHHQHQHLQQHHHLQQQQHGHDQAATDRTHAQVNADDSFGRAPLESPTVTPNLASSQAPIAAPILASRQKPKEPEHPDFSPQSVTDLVDLLASEVIVPFIPRPSSMTCSSQAVRPVNGTGYQTVLSVMVLTFLTWRLLVRIPPVTNEQTHVRTYIHIHTYLHTYQFMN
jgi:hypothetical protein